MEKVRLTTMSLEMRLKDGWQRRCPEFEIQKEQLLVYFLSTYLCGAVYDGHAYSKAQMAVVSVLLMQEILMAQWIKNEKELYLKILLIRYTAFQENWNIPIRIST